MPESEDTVGLIVEESSEESGPIQETTPAQGGETASSQEGTTAAPATPSVEELQAQLSRLQAEKEQAVSIAYRTRQAEADRNAAELRRYQDAEAAEIQKRFSNQDAWIETVSDPEKYQAFQRTVLGNMIQQELGKRDQSMRQMQEQTEGMVAFNQLQEFATNEAKMDPDQFAAFLHQNSPIDPRTGQRLPAFHGYPAAEALRIAKALIRDAHFEHFAAKVKEQEQKDADGKARRQITNALPSGVPAGGGKSQDAETFEGRYKAAIATVSTNNPRDWLSH